MAQERLLPNWLAAIHPSRRTPYRAILVILLAAVALAFSGTLANLAGTTSFLLLLVFCTVNLALIVIKYRDGKPARGFRVPMAIPVAGAASSLALMGFVAPAAIWSAVVIVLIGLGFGVARYVVLRHRK
jgi:amino acid transporter